MFLHTYLFLSYISCTKNTSQDIKSYFEYFDHSELGDLEVENMEEVPFIHDIHTVLDLSHSDSTSSVNLNKKSKLPTLDFSERLNKIVNQQKDKLKCVEENIEILALNNSLIYYARLLSIIEVDWNILRRYPYIGDKLNMEEIDFNKESCNWELCFNSFKRNFHRHKSATWDTNIFPMLILYEGFISKLISLLDNFVLFKMSPYECPETYIEFNELIIESIKLIFQQIPYKALNMQVYESVKQYPTYGMSILELDTFLSQLCTHGEIRILTLRALNSYTRKKLIK